MIADWYVHFAHIGKKYQQEGAKSVLIPSYSLEAITKCQDLKHPFLVRWNGSAVERIWVFFLRAEMFGEFVPVMKSSPRTKECYRRFQAEVERGFPDLFACVLTKYEPYQADSSLVTAFSVIEDVFRRHSLIGGRDNRWKLINMTRVRDVDALKAARLISFCLRMYEN